MGAKADYAQRTKKNAKPGKRNLDLIIHRIPKIDFTVPKHPLKAFWAKAKADYAQRTKKGAKPGKRNLDLIVHRIPKIDFTVPKHPLKVFWAKAKADYAQRTKKVQISKKNTHKKK